MANLQQPIVIDVREPEEFITGHVPGALNIPLSEVTGSTKLAGLSKDTPLIVYCRSGARASVAINKLGMQGYTNLTNGINTVQASTLVGTHGGAS